VLRIHKFTDYISERKYSYSDVLIGELSVINIGVKILIGKC